MKTIVVLGGGGFLGGCIERHFGSEGWRVIAVGHAAAGAQADVRHVWNLPHPEFAHLLAIEQPDLVVNAAGRASVPASMVEPLADFEGSTLLTFRVLDDMRRRSPQAAFIQISSAAVYGNPVSLPTSEQAAIAPISPYGWHKRLSELIVQEHATQFGMRTASLRLFSTYGPGLRRQVVWDLAQRALAEPGEALVLHGCPEDSRDFVHGTDLALAVETVLAGELAGEAYNVAAGVETPIRDVASIVLTALGRPSRIEFDERRRPGNPARWHADISKIARLGFRPQVAFENGVTELVQVIQKERKN